MSECNHCGEVNGVVIAATESGLVKQCTRCGLQYREFACEPRNVYKRPAKLAEPTHVKRQKATFEYLMRMVDLSDAVDVVIEIGSGAGVFAGMVSPHVPEVHCIEPSQTMVEALRKQPRIQVHSGDVTAIAEFRDKADLVVALGCHYLFRDHARALSDIARALRLAGYLYLESNVFQDTKGFVGERFAIRDELYTHNPMVAYWFTPGLLTDQLRRHFVVCDVRETTYGGSVVRGFLCQKVVG